MVLNIHLELQWIIQVFGIKIVEVNFKSLNSYTKQNVIGEPSTELQGMISWGINQGSNSSSSFRPGTTAVCIFNINSVGKYMMLILLE